MSPGLRRLVFALLPVTALLAIGELAARQSGVLVGGGPGGWTLTAGLEDYTWEQTPPREDFLISTNADGLRTAHQRQRTPGVRRLLVFGDSTVFGWGLPAADGPAEVLEEALGEGWEVINAGQPGFSSEQARRLAEALLPLYRPDGVIWFHPWHDVSRVALPDRALLPPEPPWWERSALISLLASPEAAPQQPQQPQSPVPNFGSRQQRDGVIRVPEAERRENLERVVSAAEDVSAWVVVGLLPTDTTLRDLLRGGGDAPMLEELKALCQELGLPLVDTHPTLSGRSVGSVTVPGDRGHFTAEANRLMMVPVVAAIQEQEAP